MKSRHEACAIPTTRKVPQLLGHHLTEDPSTSNGRQCSS